MNIPRKLTATIVISCLLALMITVSTPQSDPNYVAAFAFMFAVGITALLIEWVGNDPKQGVVSRRKVEQLLHELNDEDLDLLRNRLSADDDEVKFGSISELLESDKRKNEVR